MRKVGRLFAIGAPAIFLASATLTPLRAQTPSARIDTALQSLTASPRAGRVGYVTVWDGNKFIQCRRLSTGGMRCEAAGTLMQPSLASVLTPAVTKRLTTLGWMIDPRFGNYAHDFPAGVATQQITDHITTTLAQAYAAQLSNIEISARWVADIPRPPRAGFSQNLAGSVNDSESMKTVVVNACAFTPKPQSASRSATSATELIGRLGSGVASQIERLRMTRKDRAWVVFATEIGYVQCMPEKPLTAIYCEAQSAQSWPALAAILTPERIAKLKQAGYAEPGRAPNYSRSYPIARYSDAQIAAEILSVLYNAYGYTGAGRLEAETE